MQRDANLLAVFLVVPLVGGYSLVTGACIKKLAESGSFTTEPPSRQEDRFHSLFAFVTAWEREREGERVRPPEDHL